MVAESVPLDVDAHPAGALGRKPSWGSCARCAAAAPRPCTGAIAVILSLDGPPNHRDVSPRDLVVTGALLMLAEGLQAFECLPNAVRGWTQRDHLSSDCPSKRRPHT